MSKKQSPVPKFHQPWPDLAVSRPLARRRRDPHLTNFPFCFVTCHRRFSVVNDHINFSVIRGDKPLPTLQYGERDGEITTRRTGEVRESVCVCV